MVRRNSCTLETVACAARHFSRESVKTKTGFKLFFFVIAWKQHCKVFRAYSVKVLLRFRTVSRVTTNCVFVSISRNRVIYEPFLINRDLLYSSADLRFHLVLTLDLWRAKQPVYHLHTWERDGESMGRKGVVKERLLQIGSVEQKQQIEYRRWSI